MQTISKMELTRNYTHYYKQRLPAYLHTLSKCCCCYLKTRELNEHVQIICLPA